jgi:hypothetical protein
VDSSFSVVRGSLLCAGLLTPHNGVTEGLHHLLRPKMETFGRRSWLGQETGHNGNDLC